MPGQFAQGGVRMRDRLKNRAGFDRVLMAVAATFLAVSAASALAQDPPRNSAAELAIDAAIPEHLDRCLPVTDKRKTACQKRAIRCKRGPLKSVCRELPSGALAA